LVFAFEFSIEDHSLNAPAALIQPSRGVQVGVKEPTVVSQFTTIRWASVVGLPRCAGAVPAAALKEFATPFRQVQEAASIAADHIRGCRDQTHTTEPLDVFGEGPFCLIGRGEVAVWYRAEGSHDGQCSRLRSSQLKLVYSFAARALRQVEIPREHVKGVRVLFTTLSGI